MIGDAELLEAFLVEGRELQARAVGDLSALARNGGDTARLDSLFRAVHTLKGSTAVFDLAAWTERLHGAETLLEGARRAGAVDAVLARDLARTLDISERWLETLERDETPSEALIAATRASGVSASSPPEASATAPAPWAQALAEDVAIEGGVVALRYTPASDAFFRGEDPLAVARQLPGLVKLVVEAGDPVEPGGVYDPFHCSLRILAVSAASLAEVREAVRLVADGVELAVVHGRSAAPLASDLLLRSLRVDAARLDDLAALVDELVIARNGLDLGGGGASLDRVVSALHTAVTGLRLTPLAPLFARLPRQIHEIAETLGKPVDLLVSGERTPVDKAVVEGLFEPLLHLIRNAIDHGIEPPDERRAAGKPERATLTLSAQARGDAVVLVLSDDGRGVDIDRVRAKAVQQGVIGAQAAAELPDVEALKLIFAPGFSTADAVSAISGRGVGMDAVRSSVLQLGGSVDLESRRGRGLSVRLSLPAHVVLTKVLVVDASGHRFGAPLEMVMETRRLRVRDVTPVRSGLAYIHREKVTPLVRLTERLGLDASAEVESFPVLLVGAADGVVGVRIDAVLEQVEAPLRPLPGLLAGYPGLLGTMLQGDGRVLLVLDLQALVS